MNALMLNGISARFPGKTLNTVRTRARNVYRGATVTVSHARQEVAVSSLVSAPHVREGGRKKGCKPAQRSLSAAQRWRLNAVAEEVPANPAFITVDATTVYVDVMDVDTATVRLRTPDRAGLLNDISAAITNIGLTIESADLNTPNKEFADNTFVVKAPQSMSFANMKDEDRSSEFEDEEDNCCESELEIMLKIAVLSGVTSGVASMPVLQASDASFEPEVDVTMIDNQLVVNVTAADRQGLLSLLSGTFQTLGMKVLRANIRTLEDGTVNNRFVLQSSEGTTCSLDALAATTLQALKLGRNP